MNLFRKAFLFWFVLLVLALVNAVLREVTYKPLLEPSLGNWAHQLSSLTAIILFYFAISWFFRRQKQIYSQKQLILVGTIWTSLTLIFETLMNVYFRQLTLTQVLSTYYFWQGETWFFVLLFIFFSPLLVNKPQNPLT